MKFLARLLATVGYVGHAPVAPGTAGSLVALPVIWFAYPRLAPAMTLGFVLAACVAAIWAAQKQVSADHQDPQFVVVDEFVGQLIALLFVPIGVMTVAAGFFLFRLFDVFKPFPSRQSEKLPGGWGIVMDDVVAGIYANLALRAVIYLFDAFLASR